MILDTNIYGKIFADKQQVEELVEKINRSRRFITHNFRLIRKELRGIPKILPIYDWFIPNRIIEETNAIKELGKVN